MTGRDDGHICLRISYQRDCDRDHNRDHEVVRSVAAAAQKDDIVRDLQWSVSCMVPWRRCAAI